MYIKAYLNDTEMSYDVATQYFKEAADWAKEHCPSFVECVVEDVSDYTLYNDLISSYTFHDEYDAGIFKSMWKK